MIKTKLIFTSLMSPEQPLIRRRTQQQKVKFTPITITDSEELKYCWNQCTEVFAKHRIPFKNCKKICLRDKRIVPVQFGQQVVSYNVNNRFVRMSMNASFFAIVFSGVSYVISKQQQWDEDIEQRLKDSFDVIPVYARAAYSTNEPKVYLTFQEFMQELLTFLERYIEKESVSECVIL